MKDDTKKTEEKKEEKESEDKTVSELKQKVEEFENKYKRVLADYQNLEKRTGEEKKEWKVFANKELLLRFLPVLDTLILAHKHVQDKGIDLSIGQFLDALKNEGVIKIETVGKQFDPSLMECVDVEIGEEGKVLTEVRSGYMLLDKVLRPAQVKVGGKR